MKPGKGDIASYILITGQELVEMKRFDYPESFGLGNRIARYKGKRPLQLYQWDLECLIDTFSHSLHHSNDYHTKDDARYKALFALLQRLELLYAEVSQDT